MARTRKSIDGTGLPKADIVAAALAMVEERGADKLTMRGLSARLGVAPMSLYWYVPNKDVLLDLVCDEVIAGIPEKPVNRKRWDRALLCIAEETYLALSRHPGLAALVIERLPNEHTPHALRLLDFSASCLRKAGYDDGGAARAALTAYIFVIAHVQYRDRRPGIGLAVSERLEGVDTTSGAHAWTTLMASAPEEPIKLFRYGFLRLLDGFRAELASTGLTVG